MGTSRRTSTGGIIGTRYRLPEIHVHVPEIRYRISECLHVDVRYDKSLRERQSTSLHGRMDGGAGAGNLLSKRERRRERLWSRLELGYGGENLESRDSNRERLWYWRKRSTIHWIWMRIQDGSCIGRLGRGELLSERA